MAVLAYRSTQCSNDFGSDVSKPVILRNKISMIQENEVNNLYYQIYVKKSILRCKSWVIFVFKIDLQRN